MLPFFINGLLWPWEVTVQLCGNIEEKLGMFVIQVTLSVNKLGFLLRDGDNEHCHGNIY